jgi:hypothetical protein
LNIVASVTGISTQIEEGIADPYPIMDTLVYVYDSLNRIQTIRTSTSNYSNYSYNSNGNLESINVIANGILSGYSVYDYQGNNIIITKYDNAGVINSVTELTTNGENIIQEFETLYFASNNSYSKTTSLTKYQNFDGKYSSGYILFKNQTANIRLAMFISKNNCTSSTSTFTYYYANGTAPTTSTSTTNLYLTYTSNGEVDQISNSNPNSPITLGLGVSNYAYSGCN